MGPELPLKDPEGQQPVPVVWRGAFRQMVDHFARGDFTLEGIPGVKPVSADTAQQMRDYVADYGATLVALPDDTWRTSVAQWSDGFWDVLVDLWSSEGPTDLVLDCRVFESGEGYRFEPHLIYVP